MDPTLLFVSIMMIVAGLLGAWLPYSGVSEFFIDLVPLAIFVMVVGFILLPAGIFKDGLPSPSSKGKAIVGIVAFTIVAELIAFLLVAPK